MPKQTSGSKKCGRGGSPKKAIKRLRRKAIATLREARLTAQLELVAAEAAGAQLRERALEAAATETAQVRADAQAEIARLLEQSQLEAAQVRADAQAEIARLLEQSRLEAAQVRADAHGEVARLLEQSRLEAATAALEQRATAEARSARAVRRGGAEGVAHRP